MPKHKVSLFLNEYHSGTEKEVSHVLVPLDVDKEIAEELVSERAMLNTR